MLLIQDILQHLYKLELNKNIARLSFYNYLNLFYKKEESFDFSIVETFYLKSLYFSFWQENSISLQESLIHDLQAFSPLCSIKNLKKKELFYIKNFDNFFKCCFKIKDFIDKKPSLINNNPASSHSKKSFERQKIIKHNLCLKVFTYATGEENMQIYTNLFFLKPPFLKHLPPITSLKFSFQKVLKPNSLHYLQSSPSETVIFFLDKNNLFTGLVISGYTYKIIHSFSKTPLNKIEFLKKNLDKLQKYLDLKLIQDTFQESNFPNHY